MHSFLCILKQALLSFNIWILTTRPVCISLTFFILQIHNFLLLMGPNTVEFLQAQHLTGLSDCAVFTGRLEGTLFISTIFKSCSNIS